MSLAQRVLERRDAKGWSQDRLAEEVKSLGGKTSQQSIANIESGLVEKPRILRELSAALGVRQEWLETGKGEMHVITGGKALAEERAAYVGGKTKLDVLMQDIFDPDRMTDAERQAVLTLAAYLRRTAGRTPLTPIQSGSESGTGSRWTSANKTGR